MEDYYSARLHMVNNQLIPNQIKNQDILNAMLNIPRHIFVEENWSKVAYIDGSLPIGKNRRILEPLLLAKMLTACRIDKNSTVLDIGCGTGYSTAIIASIAKHVVAIEPIMQLAKKAKSLLQSINLNNYVVKVCELNTGDIKSAPFDVIFINGIFNKITDTLLKQLKKNGRLIVIEPCDSISKVVQYNDIDQRILREELFPATADFLSN